MDTAYKRTKLSTIKKELQLSLELYCAANNPYQLRNLRNKHISPTHRDSLHLSTLRNSQSTSKLDFQRGDHRRRKWKRQCGLSVPRQTGLLLQGAPLKVRRNHKKRDFTAYFQKHQIVRFFGQKNLIYPQLCRKKMDKLTESKQVIKDVFSPLTIQIPQNTTLHDTQSQVSAPQLGTEEEKLQVDGWSYKTIERLLLHDQPKVLSGSSLNSNLKSSDSQKEHQTSIKSLFPISSVAIIPPSSTTCNKKPTSLIFQQTIAKEQPSIKSVSSSDQLKLSRIIVQEQGAKKSDCSLRRTLPKQPSEEGKDMEIMQQLCQNSNHREESVPWLNSLHSHFNSGKNIDVTPQNKEKQSQRGILITQIKQ